MDETLCKFVLNLVVLLIIGIFVIKVPLKNIKSFDIDFKLSNGFKLNAKFYEKKNKNNKQIICLSLDISPFVIKRVESCLRNFLLSISFFP